MSYRNHQSVLVLAVKNNHEAAATIPAGQVIEVIGPAEDDRFMVVRVNSEQFHVFASDLADRARKIKAVAVGHLIGKENSNGTTGESEIDHSRSRKGNVPTALPRTNR